MELIKSEAIRIAKLAGAKIKDLRDTKQFEESLKEGYELVTTADLASHEIIKAELTRVFPEHCLLSEEDSKERETSIIAPTWIADPIDGTVGYANGQYQVAVSLAYAVEGKVQVGVVYNPFLDELFHATRGGGSFLNDKPIKVKEVFDLRQCVVGTGFPHKRDNIVDILAHLGNILPAVRDIRRLGSPALDVCWVACGRMQGFYEGKLHPWDVAASKLVAVEAGARVGYYHDKEDNIPDCLNGNHVVVASPGVFDELEKLLRR